MANEKEPSSPARNSPEPQGLLRILASVFSGVLFGLFLSKFQAPNDDSRKAIRPQDTPEPETQSSQSEPRRSFVVQPPTDSHDPQQSGRHRTPGWEKAAVVVAFGVLVVQYCQMRSTEKAAIAAENASETASHQLEMADRPWVKEIVSSNAPFLIQDGAISWAVRVQVSNAGHSVATGVFVAGKLIGMKNGDLIDGPANAMNQFCDTIAKESPINPRRWGISVFPNDTNELLGLSPVMFPKDVENVSIDGGNGKKSIFPILIGCIDYQYPTSKVRHQTRFIYDVIYKPKSGESPGFVPLEHTLPKDDMVLLRHKVSGQFAY